MQHYKKAQVDPNLLYGTVGVVILLVAVGVIFSVSFKALDTLEDIAENQVSGPTNETITWAGNNTAVSLGSYKLGMTSSIIVYNNCTPVNIGAGVNANYSFNTTDMTLKIINATPGGGSAKGNGVGTWVTNNINVTRTYYIGSQEYNTTLDTQEGIKVVSDFQPTWALIAGVGILLTVLLVPLFMWILKKI